MGSCIPCAGEPLLNPVPYQTHPSPQIHPSPQAKKYSEARKRLGLPQEARGPPGLEHAAAQEGVTAQQLGVFMKRCLAKYDNKRIEPGEGDTRGVGRGGATRRVREGSEETCATPRACEGHGSIQDRSGSKRAPFPANCTPHTEPGPSSPFLCTVPSLAPFLPSSPHTQAPRWAPWARSPLASPGRR
jgi:hypothetical protein